MNALTARAAFVTQLVKVNRKLRTLYDAQVKLQGLTLARARMLYHLGNRDGLTQKQLAQLLEVEQPSMVSLIDAMEKKGFVSRVPIEGDRRAKGIFLTEHAREEAGKIQRYSDEVNEKVLAGIDEADLQVTARVLEQIAQNIGAAG